MNLDGFKPTPVVGNQYKKADGTKISVVAIDYVDGQLYVLYEDNGEKSSVYQDGWNEMYLTEERRRMVTQGESVLPHPENPDSGAIVTLQGHKPIPKEDKVQRLQELLDSGPSGDLNPNFYPTGFAKNVSSNEFVDNELVGRLEKQLNDIQELRDKGKDKNKIKAGCLNELLWSCAGVDKPLLRMCQSDWSKKTCIGGIILGTAVFAMLSSTYAAYTVSGKIWGAIFIGLVWGVFIFILDRYLVNSMYSDGTSKITPQEWKSASPRLIIAIFIGIVISTPVEMLVFNGRIQKEIQKENRLSQNEETVYATNSELRQLKNDVDKQQTLVDTLNNQVLRYRARLHKEVTREDRPNYGSRAAVIDTLLKQTTRSWNTEDSKLKGLKDKHDNLYRTVQSSLVLKDSLQNDFSTRLQMMLKITGKHYTDSQLKPVDNMVAVDESTSGFAEWWNAFWPSNSLFWVRLFIMCFFMIIEITPVLAKMMAADGKYEEYLILESKTMDKLRRVHECNNINVTKGGPLGIYSGFILGLDQKQCILDIEDPKSVKEGNARFLVKTDETKKKKLLTDADNIRIYEHALKSCTEHIISQIDEIFNKSISSSLEVSTSEPIVEDEEQVTLGSQDTTISIE